MVGVNKYQMAQETPLDLVRISPDVEREQVQRVRERKRARYVGDVQTRLGAIRQAAKNGANVMPPIKQAVEAECTVGEISDVFRSVFGVYHDPAWV